MGFDVPTPKNAKQPRPSRALLHAKPFTDTHNIQVFNILEAQGQEQLVRQTVNLFLWQIFKPNKSAKEIDLPFWAQVVSDAVRWLT